MKLQERYVKYVRNAISIMVRDTGYPVLLKTLVESDIADRKKLEILVAEGHIKHMKVNVGGRMYNAYYTEAYPPREFMKQKEGLEPSEA